MSTRLTEKGIPMVESQSLQLVQATAKVQENTSDFLSKSLKDKGYQSATPSVLGFLGALDCGVNYGSEIARSLGVSRQMVAKTVKELCKTGYLLQVDGVGKQKQIVFTELGEHLMSDARQILADLDNIFKKEIGRDVFEQTLAGLEQIQALVEKTQA